MIFAIIIWVLVTGIVRKFLNVSLSRSIKNSIAAITPMTQGKRKITPYPMTILNSPSKRSALFGYFSNILGVAIINVIGTGNRKADKKTKGINFFRFNFKNSHLISLSNSFAPCHTLEVIFKTFFTSMRLRYLQSVF